MNLIAINCTMETIIFTVSWNSKHSPTTSAGDDTIHLQGILHALYYVICILYFWGTIRINLSIQTQIFSLHFFHSPNIVVVVATDCYYWMDHASDNNGSIFFSVGYCVANVDFVPVLNGWCWECAMPNMLICKTTTMDMKVRKLITSNTITIDRM